jgi:branched-chain amino acid transport system permease protein
MVYGVIQLINFAHGEVFMVGAYATMAFILALGALDLPWWVLLPLCGIGAVLVCAVLGVTAERLAYRPIRQAPRLNALITAIGLSFFLQNLLMLVFGATDRRFPAVMPLVRWDLGGVSVTLMQTVVWASSALLMGGLHVLVASTKLGKAMRATAQDRSTCSLLGICVDRIIGVTFAIGSMLAAVGGTLFGMTYGTINFHDGYLTGMKAFTAAVLGGIGNIPGAMVGGLVLGLLEGLSAGYLSSQWKNVFTFLILVGLLLFKPTGLLGERVAERA